MRHFTYPFSTNGEPSPERIRTRKRSITFSSPRSALGPTDSVCSRHLAKQKELSWKLKVNEVSVIKSIKRSKHFTHFEDLSSMNENSGAILITSNPNRSDTTYETNKGGLISEQTRFVDTLEWFVSQVQSKKNKSKKTTDNSTKIAKKPRVKYTPLAVPCAKCRHLNVMYRSRKVPGIPESSRRVNSEFVILRRKYVKSLLGCFRKMAKEQESLMYGLDIFRHVPKIKQRRSYQRSYSDYGFSATSFIDELRETSLSPLGFSSSIRRSSSPFNFESQLRSNSPTHKPRLSVSLDQQIAAKLWFFRNNKSLAQNNISEPLKQCPSPAHSTASSRSVSSGSVDSLDTVVGRLPRDTDLSSSRSSLLNVLTVSHPSLEAEGDLQVDLPMPTDYQHKSQNIELTSTALAQQKSPCSLALSRSLSPNLPNLERRMILSPEPPNIMLTIDENSEDKVFSSPESDRKEPCGEQLSVPSLLMPYVLPSVPHTETASEAINGEHTDVAALTGEQLVPYVSPRLTERQMCKSLDLHSFRTHCIIPEIRINYNFEEDVFMLDSGRSEAVVTLCDHLHALAKIAHLSKSTGHLPDVKQRRRYSAGFVEGLPSPWRTVLHRKASVELEDLPRCTCWMSSSSSLSLFRGKDLIVNVKLYCT